jgi:NAD(P)-dependent dehydrogenase (short-subunit alcohol dehydrogenase family)
LHNARVYIASRSVERIGSAIQQMRESAPARNLDLRVLQLDMMDLASVKAAATRFASEETRLDILINNAGVKNPTSMRNSVFADLITDHGHSIRDHQRRL